MKSIFFSFDTSFFFSVLGNANVLDRENGQVIGHRLVQKITLSPNKVVGSSNVQCGLCSSAVSSDQTLFFAHHRICLMKKMNSIICPYCPTLLFETKQSYMHHISQIHR